MIRKVPGILVVITGLTLSFQNCGQFQIKTSPKISAVTENSQQELDEYFGNQPGANPPVTTTTPPEDDFLVDQNAKTAQAGIQIPSFGGVFVPNIAVDTGGKKRAVVYVHSADWVSAYNIKGRRIWKKDIVSTGQRAAIDWNSDGVTDVFVAEKHPVTTATYCYDSSGNQTTTTAQVPYSSLHLLDGATGKTLFTFGDPVPDYCWNSPSGPANVAQWTTQSVIANDSMKAFAISVTYATQSWIVRRNAAGIAVTKAILYPSTAQFDSNYTAAKVSGWGSKFWANSHVFNGLLLPSGFGFFTSGRFLMYNYDQDLSPTQLQYDLPFLPDGKTDASGRNYGLVAKDPYSSNLYMIAGCSVYMLMQDSINATTQTDPYCGIHRHVTVINLATPAISESRYFSYAHTGGTGVMNFEKRINFPANPFLRVANSPSRVVFNEYRDGHWYLQISAPGSAQSQSELKDWVVWDVVDIDQDGTDEVLLSQIRLPSQPDVPGYYQAAYRFSVAQPMNDGSLAIRKTYDGYLPLIQFLPKRDNVSTSEIFLMGAVRDLEKRSAIFARDAAGNTRSLDY